MVLGMRFFEVGCIDFRLILDLKRVLIKVDFFKSFCFGERIGLVSGFFGEGGLWVLLFRGVWAFF